MLSSPIRICLSLGVFFFTRHLAFLKELYFDVGYYVTFAQKDICEVKLRCLENSGEIQTKNSIFYSNFKVTIWYVNYSNFPSQIPIETYFLLIS